MKQVDTSDYVVHGHQQEYVHDKSIVDVFKCWIMLAYAGICPWLTFQQELIDC